MNNANSQNASLDDADQDDLQPEYDLDRLTLRDQGTLFHEITSRQGYVHLDDEVRKVFQTDRAVNEALRTMIRLSPALQGTLEEGGKPKLAPANVPVPNNQ